MRRVLNFSFLLIFFLTSYLYNEKLRRDIEKSERKIKYELEIKRTQKPIPENYEEITIYYPNETLNKMLVSKEKIKEEKDLRDKLNSILKIIKEKTENKIYYTEDKSLEFMSEYLEIENVYFDNGALYIDFNMDFRRHFITKEHELYFTYSIVNSFVGINKIERVKFLILGKEINELKFYKLDNFLFKYEKI